MKAELYNDGEITWRMLASEDESGSTFDAFVDGVIRDLRQKLNEHRRGEAHLNYGPLGAGVRQELECPATASSDRSASLPALKTECQITDTSACTCIYVCSSWTPATRGGGRGGASIIVAPP